MPPWFCNSTWPQHTLQMFTDHYGPRHTIPLIRDCCNHKGSCTLVRLFLTFVAWISSSSFVRVSIIIIIKQPFITRLCQGIQSAHTKNKQTNLNIVHTRKQMSFEKCLKTSYRAIPWWRLWPKFENFSLLIDHSSYNKQAINHFVVDVRSTLGGQSTATPQKINLGQGQAQCPCNARWRLWLRTKVGSASESLQSPISVKCDRVLCQHLYIWWTTYC